jgi:hypothetical protein
MVFCYKNWLITQCAGKCALNRPEAPSGVMGLHRTNRNEMSIFVRMGNLCKTWQSTSDITANVRHT